MTFIRKLLAVLIVVAIGTAGYLYFRVDRTPAPVQTEPSASEGVPVTVAKAQRKTVPIVLRAIGNVQAYSTVAVKSRVDGQIFDAGFKEGQMVHKGDQLFTIDPRPFDAAVRQAEAALARDKALSCTLSILAQNKPKLTLDDFFNSVGFHSVELSPDGNGAGALLHPAGRGGAGDRPHGGLHRA